ncbi:MAG: hypothetical protein KAJ55_06585 [Anaerolineales bacterium]|nr:hypothetical protein [Anaerolineales bacterium]
MDNERLQNGVLCNLKAGRWDASTRLDKDKLGRSVPKEIVRAMQDLIEDRSRLKDIATIRRTAKGELMRHSIPFPVDGVWFVPKDQIPYLDKKFTELKAENDKRVDALLRDYGTLKTRMRRKYPAYYKPEKYPTRKELRKKYDFSWQFFNIAMPNGGKSSVLSAAMYKREQAKFSNMVKEMEEMTVNLVANRLLQRIDNLKKQCSGGRINTLTVDSVDDFLGKWEDLWSGYVDDTKMHSIMRQLKTQMKNVTADDLKDSEAVREKVGNKMDRLINKLKAIPDVQLKRKLDV